MSFAPSYMLTSMHNQAARKARIDNYSGKYLDQNICSVTYEHNKQYL